MNRTTSLIDIAFIFFYMVFSAIIVTQIDIAYPLSDGFHEGEYVGAVWHMLAYYRGDADFPLLIHGAMDYLPSLLAKIIFGDDRIIAGTRIINSFIIIITWGLFFDICRKVAKKTMAGLLFMSLPPLAILLASKNWGIALSLHHAFVGPRDFLLMLSIWAFSHHLTASSEYNKKIHTVLLVTASVLAIFWSYDRGVMAILVLGVFTALAAFKKQRSDCILIPLISLVLLSTLQATKIFGGALENLSSIIYWINNGKEAWANYVLFPISLQPMMLPLCFASLLPLLLLAWRTSNINERNKLIPLIIALILIEVLMIKTVFNRPGLPRTSWALWPLIIIFVYGASRIGQPRKKLPTEHIHSSKLIELRYIVLSAPLLLLSVTFSNYFFAIPNFASFSAFKQNIKSPPLDNELVSDDFRRVSLTLKNIAPSCFFSWTNEGVFSLLAKLPNCSKFYYLAYATSQHQSDIIDSLKNKSPSAILFDSPHWAIRIDNRPMKERFPEVNSYIESNYPYSTKIGGYLIRTKSPYLTDIYKGQSLNFVKGDDSKFFLREGWSDPESWGVWSEGALSSIKLQLPQTTPPINHQLNFVAKGYVADGKLPAQTIQVYANEYHLGDVYFLNGSLKSASLEIPKELFAAAQKSNNILNLKFKILHPTSPASAGQSGDTRELGIGLISLQIKPRE